MSQARQKLVAASTVGYERAELKRLHHRVERLFSVLEEALEIEASETFNTFSPTIDLCEAKDEVVVSVELPGIEPDEIKLTVTAKDICIEGNKKHSPSTRRATSHFCCERQYGKFRRRISLRWAININKTSAELCDGTLIVKLPKLTERRGKAVKIPIRSQQ